MTRRFWFQFEAKNAADLPIGVGWGCGVTARTLDEAKEIVRQRVFRGRDLPPIAKIVPDVDVSTLDAGHVRPNMGNPAAPGVWFPLGY